MADEDPLRFHTDIGNFEWAPDWDVITQMIETVGAPLEDMEMTKKYARYLFVINVQHAVCQAFFELEALVKAVATKDRPERGRIAMETAEKATLASLTRLRVTHFFPTPTRRNRRWREMEDMLRKLINEGSLFLMRLETSISALLEEGKSPTLTNVAAKCGYGSRETGGKILGRKLRQWINPRGKPKKILDDYVERVKTGLSTEYQIVRDGARDSVDTALVNGRQ